MFIGEHRHGIDGKGRLQVPAKWRAQLAAGAVVTKGFDGSLVCYPLGGWAETAAGLQALPQSQPAVRAYVRRTLAGAADLELDAQGRYVIPPYLRLFAGLTGELVLAGLSDRFEIWDAGAWDSYSASVDGTDPEHAATLEKIGI